MPGVLSMPGPDRFDGSTASDAPILVGERDGQEPLLDGWAAPPVGRCHQDTGPAGCHPLSTSSSVSPAA